MKNLHAVQLGRLGGLAGGPARAKTLSPERRSEIARHAVLVRWSKCRATRMKMAQKIADETGADVGILEHALRLRSLSPTDRLAQGLKLGRLGRRLHTVSP